MWSVVLGAISVVVAVVVKVGSFSNLDNGSNDTVEVGKVDDVVVDNRNHAKLEFPVWVWNKTDDDDVGLVAVPMSFLRLLVLVVHSQCGCIATCKTGHHLGFHSSLVSPSMEYR